MQRARARRSAAARAFIRAARWAYQATPFQPLRALYFDVFCRLVREKVIRCSLEGTEYELDLGEVIDLCLYLGRWEPEVGAAIDQHCSAGQTVLDIGANVGAHTFRMARRVGPAGRVFAFEPTEFAFRKLSRNLELNSLPQVTAVRLALAGRSASAQRVDFRASWRTDGSRRDGETVVDFVRLDDWWSEHGAGTPSVVKLDVDGGEYGVLEGGLSLVQRSRPVFLMEAVGPHFADPKRNPFVLLRDLGYSFSDASTHRRYETVEQIGSQLPPDDPRMTCSINLFATPASGTARDCG